MSENFRGDFFLTHTVVNAVLSVWKTNSEFLQQQACHYDKPV